MEHKYYNYHGYEDYGLRGLVTEQVYLSWTKFNDSKIKNPNFDWNSIFKADDYLFYTADSDGVTFPQLPAFRFWGSKEFFKTRVDEYNEFLDSYQLNKLDSLDCLNKIHAFHIGLKNGMNEIIEILEKHDSKIRDVLKVFYYECDKHIKPSDEDIVSKEKYFQLVNDITSLYRIIKQGIKAENLEKHWIPKRISRDFVPEPIGRSLKIGVLHIQSKKEPLLSKLGTMYKQLVHLETITNRILNGKTILDESIKIENPLKVAIQKYDDSYWDTVREYRDESQCTWPEAYEWIENERWIIGMKPKYSSFESFKSVMYK